jgi:hypothetical protein
LLWNMLLWRMKKNYFLFFKGERMSRIIFVVLFWATLLFKNRLFTISYWLSIVVEIPCNYPMSFYSICSSSGFFQTFFHQNSIQYIVYTNMFLWYYFEFIVSIFIW